MVNGSQSTYESQEVRGREAALGDHAPRLIATNLQVGFSNRARGGGHGTVPLRSVRDGQ